VRLTVLTRDDVVAAVPMPAAIDAVAGAYSELSRGRAQSPVRLGLHAPLGTSLFMPGYLEESGALGAKIVSVFQKNPQRGLPSINGIVLLLDPETGVPMAIMDGTYLTALRTGAGSGAATRVLARHDAHVLTVYGAGGQARAQIDAVRAVRDIREVRIVSRTGESARVLAAELDGVEARAVDDPAEAAGGADVICAATTSSEPVFPADAAGPGVHVNGVGSFTPDMQEIAGELLLRARVFVDARDAALEEAGDLIIPIRDGLFGEDHIVADIGEVLDGRAEGRTSADQITYFKSVGNAVQDVAVGLLALREAERRGLGQTMDL
jgi:ornithine cyclodeaminase/alanine dehydrogenase-like protein (mu-crystallin family)